MFNNKRRIHSAWARGLMFGKAAGARDERERIIALLIEQGFFCNGHWHHECQNTETCSFKRSGSWHGVAPCESDFMGGNDCKRAIDLIRKDKYEN